MTRRAIQRRNRRGFLSLEFMAGLLLLLAAFGLLLEVESRRIRVVARLADERAALRLAEETLLSIRHEGLGADATTKPVDERITIKRLPDPAPPAHAWVEVTARGDKRTVTLSGLVPIREGK